MRRMYSKEQLQKLIDEVSRLIAIEELDKVVPVPTLADAGKVMIVNEAGTGYELKIAEPLLMENIEDEDGHKRFVEGNITFNSVEGVVVKYAKWSLSGTHLMIVLALENNTENDITITPWVQMASVSLPQWILNKIYPIGGDNNVSLSSVVGFDENLTKSTNPLSVYISKVSSVLSITCWGSPENVLESGKTYRIAFDLLIDNE